MAFRKLPEIAQACHPAAGRERILFILEKLDKPLIFC
jgi:hypothetical protein